jgi:hypothetical protein
MGYKLLGFVVWKGAKLYVGRRLGPHAGAKALAAGGGFALLTTALVLGVRRLTADE